MSQQQRNSRTFKLDPQLVEQAQAQSAEQPMADPLEPYSRINASAPLIPKRLKRTLIALSLLISGLLIANLASLVNQLNQLHWLAGALTAILFGGLGLYAIASLLFWVRGSSSIRQMEELQYQSAQMRHTNTPKARNQTLSALLDFYRGKPQEGSLRAAIEQLPDYASDAEVIAQLETQFVAPLDSRADKLIQRYSLQTGLSVAASPFPVLDILLTLWRCQILVSEISELYGVQPSLINRLRILMRVLRAMAYSGLTETSIGLADLSNIPLGQLGARTAQGLGAAVASARLGLVAARLCRPIPSAEDEKSVFKKLASAILVLLGKKILGR